MEKLALYELARHLSLKNISDFEYQIFPGGVEVELPLSVGYALNYVLKIPVRILLRVIEAEAKTEEEFQDLLLKANLKQYMPLGNVSVSSRSSFLRFKKSLEQLTYKCVQFKPSSKGADIFIRFFRDVCTISVNTSGADLYFRGYDKWVSEAPVRDNIASGLLQLLLKGVRRDQEVELIDPMAGSGTFLLEAFLMDRPVERDFSFQNWGYDKNSFTNSQNYSTAWKFFAYDQLEKNKGIIEHNGAVFKMPIHVAVEDLFKAVPRDPSRNGSLRVVICNPPYGKRLKTSGSQSYFQDILNRIVDVYSPDRIGMLTPPAWLEQSQYERIHLLDIENSGVETQFAVFYKNDLL